MSRQVVGPWADLLASTVADNGAPSGNQAGRLVVGTNFKAVPYTIDWQIFVEITGTGDISADLFLWGRDDEDSVWGTIGLNNGQLNNGVTIEGTTATRRYFGYQNIVAGFSDLYLEVLDLTGTNAAVVAKIRPVYTCEHNGIIG